MPRPIIHERVAPATSGFLRPKKPSMAPAMPRRRIPHHPEKPTRLKSKLCTARITPSTSTQEAKIMGRDIRGIKRNVKKCSEEKSGVTC